MKKLLRFALLSLAATTLLSCNEKVEQTELTALDIPNQLEVIPSNVEGTWYLAEWNGAALAEGSFVYLDIKRKDKLFTMYDNLNSFSTAKTTGRYNILTDDLYGPVVRGEYDYNNGDWAHRYIVRGLTESQMIWIAKDDLTDISIYKRCDKVPDEVVNGKTIQSMAAPRL